MSSRSVLLITSLGSLLLFGGLLLLFAALLRTNVVEPGGWFAEPAVYTVTPWSRASGWALLFTLGGGLFLHTALMGRFYYKNTISRCLETGQLGRAWELAIRFDEFGPIESHLQSKDSLGTRELRNSILNALQHLRRLRVSASDPLNDALPDLLRDNATGHAEKGLAVLGRIVERLVLFDRQGIDPQKLDNRLDKIRRNVDHLAATTETARLQLANLSLGAEHDSMVEEASLLMRQVSVAAEELHQFDNAMSLWESSGPGHTGSSLETA
jgi:hypothetical protein